MYTATAAAIDNVRFEAVGARAERLGYDIVEQSDDVFTLVTPSETFADLDLDQLEARLGLV
jgi:hypothetical protein